MDYFKLQAHKVLMVAGHRLHIAEDNKEDIVEGDDFPLLRSVLGISTAANQSLQRFLR